jgi:hypothetical protein
MIVLFQVDKLNFSSTVLSRIARMGQSNFILDLKYISIRFTIQHCAGTYTPKINKGIVLFWKGDLPRFNKIDFRFRSRPRIPALFRTGRIIVFFSFLNLW